MGRRIRWELSSDDHCLIEAMHFITMDADYTAFMKVYVKQVNAEEISNDVLELGQNFFKVGWLRTRSAAYCKRPTPCRRQHAR